MTESSILTCVYCGMQYPEGTPPTGAQVLTDHIRVCEKHPLREAEQKIIKLRSALAGLVLMGDKESKELLSTMLQFVQAAPIDEVTRTATSTAVQVLLDTYEKAE